MRRSSAGCRMATRSTRALRWVESRCSTSAANSSQLPSEKVSSFGHGWCFAMDERASVVTVGTFDGVHLGHREILRRVRTTAAAKDFRAVVVTFRPHPLAIVNPSAAPMLLTPDDEQLDALQADGALEVVVLDFTPALARHTADEFV